MKKLALAMIVKDDSEAEILYRCLQSVAKYVDGIFITVTGVPSEKIEKVVTSFKGQVQVISPKTHPWVWDWSKPLISKKRWEEIRHEYTKINPQASTDYLYWRGLMEKVGKGLEGTPPQFKFDEAREISFQFVPDGFDYILWCDSDDVWEGAEKLKAIVETMAEQNLTSMTFDYNYEIAKDGTISIVQPRERITKKGYYRWKAHLHETQIPIRDSHAAKMRGIYVNHFPKDGAKKVAIVRNQTGLELTYREEEELFKVSLREEKHDPRTEYYLGRQYFDMGKYHESEKLFTDYQAHSGWPEERALASNYLGLISVGKGNYPGAREHFIEALKQYPAYPTWYVNMAYTYTLESKWEEATHWCKLFLATPEPQKSAIYVPIDDQSRYYDVIFKIAVGTRKPEEALEAAKELVKLQPDNLDFKARLEDIERLSELVSITKSAEILVKELEEKGESVKIPLLLSSLPGDIADNAYVEMLRQKYTPPRNWPENSIVYDAGRSMEEWTPDSLKTGVGGSETAIIQLSKQWQNAGKQVTVFGNVGTEERLYDGVDYKNYYRMNRADTFDTQIIWRAPVVLDTVRKGRVFLDLHDVPNPSEFTPERVAKVTKIFVKSNYHRSLLPNVPDAKFVVVPNGIDPDMFKWGKAKRDPYKLIYASSYDRGLEMVLRYGWPIIKKAVPQATLDIYYGWNLFDTSWKDNPGMMAWKKEMVELMKQPGIRELGRVGQSKLIEEKSKAAIHYYPTTFEEIDCISVRESAAAGAVPVTTDYAALKEKPYLVKVPGDPRDIETQTKIAEKVVELLNNQPKLEGLRKQYQELAKKETWKWVADIWLKELQ